LLLTTYLANLKNVPDNANKIFIARTMPKLDPKLHVIHDASFAPSFLTLNTYKDGLISWDKFEYLFKLEIETSFMKFKLKKLASLCIDNDVALICYEKDNTQCHRRLLAEHMKVNYNTIWKEMETGTKQSE